MQESKSRNKICPIYPNGKKPMLCVGSDCACWATTNKQKAAGHCGLRTATQDEYALDMSPNNRGQ